MSRVMNVTGTGRTRDSHDLAMTNYRAPFSALAGHEAQSSSSWSKKAAAGLHDPQIINTWRHAWTWTPLLPPAQVVHLFLARLHE